jgi:hypothetical protein
LLLLPLERLQSQNLTIDENEIPYDISGLNCGIGWMHQATRAFYSYPTDGINSFGGTVFEASYCRRTYNTIDAGIEYRFSIFYGIAHKNLKRFRFADSYIAGGSMGFSTSKLYDEETGERKKISDGSAVGHMVGGSYVLAAGFKAYYRLSNALDAGIICYPLYINTDIGATISDNYTGATLSSIGGHLRVGKIYLDEQCIRSPKYLLGTDTWYRRFSWLTEAKYVYNGKLRYFFVNCLYQKYDTYIADRTGGVPVKNAGNYTYTTLVPQKWIVCRAGWGIMF